MPTPQRTVTSNPLSHRIVIMVTMNTAQLTLIADDRPWRLDEGTRRVGRQGVAKARAALAASRCSAAGDRCDDHELAA